MSCAVRVGVIVDQDLASFSKLKVTLATCLSVIIRGERAARLQQLSDEQDALLAGVIRGRSGTSGHSSKNSGLLAVDESVCSNKLGKLSRAVKVGGNAFTCEALVESKREQGQTTRTSRNIGARVSGETRGSVQTGAES
ncbi:predicted protein [Pyrenophora tritici-repentis Pt-1C-BFP]|uniref:Uncharacterized protein n=1 Tax=Pyrenophora tritici-repentis (strain Pt-1C-BFP) TaxID=426418 RepID=B2VUK2_PYRTR|nr:uncharacterized protein PTRG_01058 [Pyrenophora tritici-repentis Pt-1C-BFP]EDU40496.1 predicted protein [Pyrenophora tritici-repentis Pt-1C-BFP]